MAQISKGDTFTNGEQVTGSRLNQLVDASTLLVGAITEQPNITANTLEATDSTIVNDSGTLKEATIGDILNSNLPITTSSITGGAGVDITVTPAATKKFDVGGAFEAESINSVGNTTVGGTLTVTGATTHTGATTLTGNVTADNGFLSNGVANFTGTLQVNGSVGYVLTEIVEENIAPWSAAAGLNNAFWTSSSITKPTGEIWILEMSFRHQGARGYVYEFAGRYGSQTAQTGSYLFYERWHDGAGGGALTSNLYTFRLVVPSATTLTSETVKLDAFAGSGSGLEIGGTTGIAGSLVTGTIVGSKFRIYKYKTA